MKLSAAAEVLGQLGNETRLRIVRLLVRAGGEGLPVGTLQGHLDIPASTLSHHVRYLKQAGLIDQERVGTTLYCSMRYDTMEAVIAFLTDQCCADASASRVA